MQRCANKGVAGGQPGVPGGRGARRGERPVSLPGGHLEATAVSSTAPFPTTERRDERRAAPQEVGAPIAGQGGIGGLAPPDPAQPSTTPAAGAGEEWPPPPVSLPVVLAGSCCPVPSFAPLPQGAAVTAATAAGSLSTASADPSLLPLCPVLPQHRNPDAGVLSACPLLSLGLLQIFLGCSLVALNFRTLPLSDAPQVKNACSFWAGFSVILSGILGLMTWKRPVEILVNLFVLLSVICVLLGLAGFTLGCQGLQLLSSVPRCNLKLLFVLCTLNALAATVSLVAAALPYVCVCATERSNTGEDEVEDQHNVLDPDVFIPPVPPPSYFATSHLRTLQTSHRMHGSDVIPLPCTNRVRVKGVYCPLDPPPPYEAGLSHSSSEQAMAPSQQATSLNAHELPSRQHVHLGFLHLDSCGDLSTFTTYEDQLAARRIQRAKRKQHECLTGGVRETVL